MLTTNNYKLKKPEGTDPVDVQDFNDNADIIDKELKKRPLSTGNASDMTTEFSQETTRVNLTSGETLKTSLGKIMKWFADIKEAAFARIAYNDTTTTAGYVADARAVKVHGDEIDTLNSALSTHKSSADHDGRYYTEAEVNAKLASKQDASTAINSENIGRQSVNYANTSNSANNAGYATKAGYADSAGNAGRATNDSGGYNIHNTLNQIINGYLAKSGGSINGNLDIVGGLSTDYVYTHTPGGTLHLNVAGWLNIETDQQLQVRNKADNAWKPVAASAFNQQSSRRYKKNIEDMTEECARKILKLRPVIYDYKNETDGTGCMGFIAEEVNEIITYPVAYNENGEVEGIDYSKFAPQIVKMQQIHENEINNNTKAIKELTEILQKQQEQINDMKNRITG